MSWLDKIPQKIKRAVDTAKKKNVPEGLWSKCESCMTVLYKTDLDSNQQVCPKCSHHNRIGARERLNVLLDDGKRAEIGANIEPIDRLNLKTVKVMLTALKPRKKMAVKKMPW